MGAIEGKWAEALAPEFKKPYYRALYEKVREAYRTTVVYPPADDTATTRNAMI